MNLSITNLKHHPQHLPTLAEWHHQQWAELNPGQTLQQRIANMQAYLNDDLVPSTWIALQDGVLLGSAALIACDMETHAEWSPWLASVFVAPEFRGQGVGSCLVQHVRQQSQQAGLANVYLFTPDQSRFYQGLGWQVLQQEDYRGHSVTIMQLAEAITAV